MPGAAKKLGLYLRAQATLLHWLGWQAIAPRGFYIPYRYAADVRRPRERDTVAWLRAVMDRQRQRYLEHLALAHACNERFDALQQGQRARPGAPRFDQTWFPGLDAAMAYAMVTHYRPRRVIEVGSGHSTRFLAQAVGDGGLDTAIFSIDPQPRREIDALCTEVWRETVTRVPLERLTALAANDILFIDGSHLALPGTDVDYLLTRVLPELQPGVLVHLHDIFLPHGYPERWPFDHYSEQNLLLAALGGGERYEILCPNAYLRRYCREATLRVRVPHAEPAPESSFWLRVRRERPSGGPATSGVGGEDPHPC